MNSPSTLNDIITNLKELLPLYKVKVTFTKVDGTERTMLCTTNPSVIPQQESSDKPHAENPDVMRVWDLEKEGWRSFRLANVIGYKCLQRPL